MFLIFQQNLLLQPCESLSVLSMCLRPDGSGFFSTLYCPLQANTSKLPKGDANADARVHNKPRTDRQIESPCWTQLMWICAHRHQTPCPRALLHAGKQMMQPCCVLMIRRAFSRLSGSTWRWNRAAWCLQGVNDFSELDDICCQISTSFTKGFTSALKHSLKQHTNLTPKGLTTFLFLDV